MENEHVRLFAVQGEGEGCSVGALLIDAAAVGNGGATSGGSQGMYMLVNPFKATINNDN